MTTASKSTTDWWKYTTTAAVSALLTLVSAGASNWQTDDDVSKTVAESQDTLIQSIVNLTEGIKALNTKVDRIQDDFNNFRIEQLEHQRGE